MISKHRPTKGRMGTPFHIETIYPYYYSNPNKKKSKKKTKHKAKSKSQQKVKSNKLLIPKLISPCNNNASLVEKASERVCDLCAKTDINISIYYINENKTTNLDSILNMVALCNECSKKVARNKSTYEELLIKQANNKIDKILALNE